MKTCTKCFNIKPEEDYAFSLKSKGILRSYCKDCGRKSCQEYKQRNKDKISQSVHAYYLKNRDKVLAYNKKYKETNSVLLATKRRTYLDSNKEYVRKRYKLYYEASKDNNRPVRKAYYTNNRLVVNEKKRVYCNKRYKTDILYRIKVLLRTGANRALKNCADLGSAVDNLGCSIQHLKLHLELFWDEGMSWANYGSKEGQWSIDHIKPLSLAKSKEEAAVLHHYTNLQPLWHKDNLLKSDRYDYH
jgi:hypothetical protein